jgi:lipid A ethanolaminephosphotransferase
LEDCTSLEISNTYDNALLHTNSLGEYGVYLLGMPRLFAPEMQTHVPMVRWLSDNFDPTEIDISRLKASLHKPFIHDAIFHTILGLMEIETGVYRANFDLVDRSQADTIPKATVEPMLPAE